MACSLFGAKSLPKPGNKFQKNFTQNTNKNDNNVSHKFMWKFRLQNGSHFVLSALVVLYGEIHGWTVELSSQRANVYKLHWWHSGTDNCTNRSIYDTSNRFGTNTLWVALFKKKKRGPRKISIWPPFSKMAAMGCVIFCLKMAVNDQKDCCDSRVYVFSM